MKKADLIIENIGELLTCKENAEDHVGLLKNQNIAICGNKIVSIGSYEKILPMRSEKTIMLDAKGNVVAPGFVDCHTHVVFGGDRLEEYSSSLEGITPEELKKRGISTGIFSTVLSTRHLSEKELYNQTQSRVLSMILAGTTTLESKSGYGLDYKTEVKQLKINQKIGKNLPVRVVSTYLGGHGWPPDIGKNEFIKFLMEEMIPIIGTSKLAEFFDMWCENIGYSVEECRKILSVAKQVGLKLKIHTDQNSYIGGTDLAAEIGAISADHLNFTPRSVLGKLARTGVIGVVLPGIDFTNKSSYPFNAIPMAEEKLEIGLATNCCPACWCTSIPFVIRIGCRNHGLTPARAIRAATLGGAKAVDKFTEVGSIEVGKNADIQIWNIDRFEKIAYQLGNNPVNTVIFNGKITVLDGSFCNCQI